MLNDTGQVVRDYIDGAAPFSSGERGGSLNAGDARDSDSRQYAGRFDRNGEKRADANGAPLSLVDCLGCSHPGSVNDLAVRDQGRVFGRLKNNVLLVALGVLFVAMLGAQTWLSAAQSAGTPPPAVASPSNVVWEFTRVMRFQCRGSVAANTICTVVEVREHTPFPVKTPTKKAKGQ